MCRWGNKLSNKNFLAEKFVIKHIKTKFDDLIQAEKEKVWIRVAREEKSNPQKPPTQVSLRKRNRLITLLCNAPRSMMKSILSTSRPSRRRRPRPGKQR